MITVSFSGIDGAGKSTQIDGVRDYLSKHRYSYRLYSFWDDVVALRTWRERMSHKVFRGDRGVGSPSNPIRRRDKNVTAWYVVLLRFCFYTLDAIKLRSMRQNIASKFDVIIFDRYIYDELANLPLRFWLGEKFAQMLLKIVPLPDCAFLLDAEPEDAITRKPEYPLNFVRRNRNAYLSIATMTAMIVLPPARIESTAEAITAALNSKLLANSASSPADIQRVKEERSSVSVG
jgi:thymidylate kinase